MKKPPEKFKLSIVILNHNTEALLRQCLDSLPKHASYQVIVVDNASTDSSVKMVEKEFPWVQLIESKTNLGFTKGNNLAKSKVIGEFVLFLNSDTVVYPGTVEAMVEFMEKTPKVGIATCLVTLPDGSPYYACHRGFPTPWNSFCYFTGLAKLFPDSKLFAGYTATYLPIDKIHEIDACSGTFLLIRREILEEIDWFDEDYYAYGEDIEMCYQVKSLGYKVMFNPQVKIMHYWGASSGLKSSSKAVKANDLENSRLWNQARYDAMRIFYDKHYQKHTPVPVNWLIYLGIKLANYLRRGKD